MASFPLSETGEKSHNFGSDIYLHMGRDSNKRSKFVNRGGSFSPKTESANPAQLSSAQRVHDSRLRPNQTLVIYPLAGLA
jgi:hypothetical protein